MATIHDSGYKLLFSNRTFFRQLMETFVDQPWVKHLDFDRAERVEKSFVDEEYQEWESDLIYRVPLGDEEIWVYVLMEFQSTVDRLMALRVLNYVVSLYMDLTRGQYLGKLPPIFPIVLYNGDARWTAVTDLADLIETEPSLGEYGLHFRYWKLAENEFSHETLLQIGNVVSTLFLAETRLVQERLLAEMVALFDREEDKNAVSLLVNWFRHMAIHKRVDVKDYKQLEDAYRSSEEIKTMLVTMIEEDRQSFFEKGIEKGIEQGIEEGIEKGLEEGQRRILLAMAERGYSVELIADMVGLTAEEVGEIIAGRMDALKPPADDGATLP